MLRYLLIPKPKPDPLLDALRTLTRAVHNLTNRIAAMEDNQMANFDALNAKLDTLTAAVSAAQTRIAEDFQALKDQLGDDATDQAAVDAAVARVDESIAALSTVDPDPTNPPVQPL